MEAMGEHAPTDHKPAWFTPCGLFRWLPDPAGATSEWGDGAGTPPQAQRRWIVRERHSPCGIGHKSEGATYTWARHSRAFPVSGGSMSDAKEKAQAFGFSEESVGKSLSALPLRIIGGGYELDPLPGLTRPAIASKQILESAESASRYEPGVPQPSRLALARCVLPSFFRALWRRP